MADRIIAKELRYLTSNQVAGMYVSPTNYVREWRVTMIGPPGSRYADGTFHLRVVFPQDYNNSPPRLIFVTTIYHMNVYEDGNVCTNALNAGWNPGHSSVLEVLMAVQQLLQVHNPKSPARGELGRLFQTDREQYFRNCIAHTRQFAM
ncbi:hypothetical protein WJX72_007904 [[Myrmecia] bisecta]|uniref:UBC core domain-containing protein n=1 Tax=[Myrmecia] bisecta TaxID=41462 RepID=A0AAW1QS95_9CHLO